MWFRSLSVIPPLVALHAAATFASGHVAAPICAVGQSGIELEVIHPTLAAIRALDFRQAVEELGVPYEWALTRVRDQLEGNFAGLSNDELVALYAYTMGSTLYDTVNAALWREGELPENIRVFTGMLRSALAKIPPANHPSVVVERTTNLRALLGAHQPGAVVSYPAFISTTLGQRPLEGRNDGSVHHLRIRSVCSGRLIAEYSAANAAASVLGNPENEVLFAPGARFRVDRRQELGNGRVAFELSEVCQ